LKQDWLGYGPQKNTGLAHAAGKWALFIDADEEVPPNLAQNIIQAATKDSPVDFYWLRIVTVFLGHELRHLYGHNPRLFRVGAGCWTNDIVHEQVQNSAGLRLKLGDDKSLLLGGTLTHYSHSTIASYLKKMHHYTSLDAAQMKKTGRHRSGKSVENNWWLPYHLAVKQFIKLYFYRQGFLDGYAGLMWCLLSARYEWEMGQKYIQGPTNPTHY
jgi:glycosyltransferase involved in cell wall biosynthesis